jgi:16S rRNA processing protein RimM
MSEQFAGHLVEIGVVGRPHGVRGELRVYLHNPESGCLTDRKCLLLGVEGETTEYTLDGVRRGSGQYYLVLFRGVKSRQAADQLKGSKLYVARASLPEVGPDEFYVIDLVGLEALDGDQPVGKITSSRDVGGVEMVTITGRSEEMEVPLVGDYVTEVQWETGRILLCNIEDLPKWKVVGRR